MESLEEVNTKIRYTKLPKKKESGATYTPPELARFVAQQILKNASHLSRDTNVRILDPAVGDGELLVCLIKELKAKGYQKISASGFDTDPLAVERASVRLKTEFPEVSTNIALRNFLETLVATDESPLEKYDLVIANPPYVRTQILGAKQANELSLKFGLSGRVDLYYAFLLGISLILNPQSVVGIIVSNRFMTTKAGTSVRAGLWERFILQGIWDFGDTRLFDAAVLPAVMVFRPRDELPNASQLPVPFVSIYSSSKTAESAPASDLFDRLSEPGVIKISSGIFEIKTGNLHFGERSEDVWRIEDNNSAAWLSKVKEHTFCTFKDVGKIRVGVKTTADNIFISTNWAKMNSEEMPELLRPLITHHVANQFRSVSESKYKILYPHAVVNNRRIALDLACYPRSEKYLASHRAQLEGRKYVIEAGRRWYEIWVPQDPSAWAAPKIVFRDISEKPMFWMDREGSIVNGDCYWITADAKDENLLWLILAVANSTFIESFYDQKFNNKLYSNRRRFMTQYVEQFPLPNPELSLSKMLVSKVKNIYDKLADKDAAQEIKDLNDIVWQLFGLVEEKIGG